MKRIETKVLFRCSGLGDLMGESKGKSNLELYNEAVSELEKSENYLKGLGIKAIVMKEKTAKKIEGLKIKITELEKVKDVVKLSASCRKYLKTMAIEIQYKRKKRMTNKYIKKGIAVENASIELYSEWKGYHLDNNTKRVSNDFLTGETDLEFTDVKGKVNKVTDIKSSYDIDSFEDNRDEDAKKSNYLQLQGYCILHDCQESSVANVLTNNDFTLINDEIRRETYKLKADELEGFDVPLVRVLEIAKDNIFDYDSFIDFLENSPFIDRSELGKLMLGDCEDLEAQEMFNSFVEVDLDDRVIEIEIERSEETEKQIIERVEICRKYLADVYNIHHVA